jgi:signal transduction histidine kinase
MRVFTPSPEVELFPDPMTLDHTADLQTVLNAWHGATVRLEQTHEALGAEVRRLTDELEVKNRELARKNRLADLGQIAAHVAHEVRNNMVPITLYLSLLRRRLSEDSGSSDILGKIESGFLALDATVNDLLNFTSDRDPHWQTFSLRAAVDDVLQSVRPQLDAQSIETDIDMPVMLTVRADYNMVRRAVLNLTLNALDAMPKGGELVITGCDGLRGVELEIADSGPGLTDDSRRRAFEPFYSTKSNGTGLGLAIVHRIAEVHGGGVQCANCAEGGAAFTLRFPRARAMEAAA